MVSRSSDFLFCHYLINTTFHSLPAAGPHQVQHCIICQIRSAKYYVKSFLWSGNLSQWPNRPCWIFLNLFWSDNLCQPPYSSYLSSASSLCWLLLCRLLYIINAMTATAIPSILVTADMSSGASSDISQKRSTAAKHNFNISIHHHPFPNYSFQYCTI